MGDGNAYTPARAGFVGDTYMPDNEMADSTKDRDLVSLNIAAPVRSMTVDRSGVYIYNSKVMAGLIKNIQSKYSFHIESAGYWKVFLKKLTQIIY